MTHRSTIGRKLGLSRGLAWLAVYAFVLQTVLAPIGAAAATTAVPVDAAQVVLCAEHAAAATSDQNQPIAPHDHEAICKFCIGCPANALLAPDALTSSDIDFAITAIRWHSVFSPGPDHDFFAGKQARGPPPLT